MRRMHCAYARMSAYIYIYIILHVLFRASHAKHTTFNTQTPENHFQNQKSHKLQYVKHTKPHRCRHGPPTGHERRGAPDVAAPAVATHSTDQARIPGAMCFGSCAQCFGARLWEAVGGSLEAVYASAAECVQGADCGRGRCVWVCLFV